MHCPECKSLNDDAATACSSCGLLLLNAAPKRRAEDLGQVRRRASDRDQAVCRFCNGEVKPNAVRCRHCSEILNEDFYRERAQKVRSRVNYASWVAYIFGLGALMVMKPVGVLSIAAGLVLSIIYYAIPVEPPASKTAKEEKKRSGFGSFLKRQMKLERVEVPIPRLRNKKLVFVGTPLVAALIGYSANLILVQEPVNDVMKENKAFAGMQVSAHYEYWVVPGVVVYDLRGLSFKQTPIDVHTAFLEFAKKVRAKRYSRVDLSYKGTTKFSIDGASFSRLGDEYAKRNFDFVLYSFPRLFHKANGQPAEVTGDANRDALLQFHRQWYGSDAMTKAVVER